MKLFKSLLVSLLAFCSVNSYAADSYDASTNTLTIPLVNVNNTYYSNVKINVGVVVSVGSKDASAPAYDTYNATTNQLTIPEVAVGSTTYYNVVITVGPILSVGATCATAAACTTSSTSTASLYGTPATYATAIQTSYAAGTLTSVSALTARSRYLISDSAIQNISANYLQIGDTYSATSGYAVESGNITSSATYETYLRKLVQVVADSSGYYRLDPHLHPNNSIDFDSTDGNKLKFRNNFGKASNLYGYVTFSYDSSTKLL